jgi:uncharacterized membrane protein (DUF106 family)
MSTLGAVGVGVHVLIIDLLVGCVMARLSLSQSDVIRLKAMRKAMRETSHSVKPMRTTDKKKERSKYACRGRVDF